MRLHHTCVVDSGYVTSTFHVGSFHGSSRHETENSPELGSSEYDDNEPSVPAAKFSTA